MTLIQSGSKFILLTQPHLKLPFKSYNNFFSLYCPSEQIVSDNGPAFTSHEFKDYMKQCGIHQLHTSPYHPSSSGLTPDGKEVTNNIGFDASDVSHKVTTKLTYSSSRKPPCNFSVDDKVFARNYHGTKMCLPV